MPRRPETPDDNPLIPDDDDAMALSDLASLAASLGEAAGEAEKEARIAADIGARISVLTPEAQKRLFTRPEMRKLLDLAGDKEVASSPDDPPGTVYFLTINGQKTAWGKKPWNWRDLYNPRPPQEPMPTKTWIPERRMTLGWNGLLVTVHQRRAVTLPEVFYGVYQDALRNEELAEEHAAWLFKKRHTLTDPSIVTPDGAGVRALANHDGALNTFLPGGGVPALDHDGPNDLDRESAA